MTDCVASKILDFLLYTDTTQWGEAVNIQKQDGVYVYQ